MEMRRYEWAASKKGKISQQQPLLGAPARSAHRSPEIHGPTLARPYSLPSSLATSMYHCLTRPAPRQEYAAQNVSFDYCLGYTRFMNQFDSQSLWSIVNLDTLSYCRSDSHVKYTYICKRIATLISYGTIGGQGGLYFQNIDTSTIFED